MLGPELPLVLLAIVGGAIALGVVIALIVIAFKVTGSIFKAIFFLIGHVVRVILGIVKDAVRIVTGTIAAIVSLPLATANVVLGRWPAAERFGRALKRESMVAGYSVYSIALRRPLQLVGLVGILDRVEGRSPNLSTSLVASPAVTPVDRRSAAAFEGYDIEGTLRPGGSGAKLYVAAPSADKRRRLAGTPDKVVIKSFALEEGSSLPQIVRESRALDAARAMGLVLDHGLDDGRFWYAMPYHPGDNLNETTRYLHARAGADGLDGLELGDAMSYVSDLVATLARYHEGGLWHKDVKPDNIIVHNGRAHLVDLGLVTPLRSAMTLTTHGTEYFRDPEMVRQALRGVRVHQVDGARFDVYGAGAVLYFLLENTFPAHGGLSSFTKRSPEALRWIVRRSMADYHQRYATARAMQADLDAVARARDPWSVRPADLPSMRGADLDAVVTPAAATWMPPASPGVGVGAGMGLGGMGVAAAVASPPLGATGRPKLVVTNWWTGSYAAQDVSSARAREAVAVAAAARAVVDDRRERGRSLRGGPRQVASTFGAVAGIVIVVLVAVFFMRQGQVRSTLAPVAPQKAVDPTAALVQRSSPPATLKAPMEGARLILINDHPGRGTPEVDAVVERIGKAWGAKGFALAEASPESAAAVDFALAKLRGNVPSGRDEFEKALLDAGFWGALRVEAEEGTGPSVDRLVVKPYGQVFEKTVADAKASGNVKKGTRDGRRRNAGSSGEVVPVSSGG
jgi:serine/threonine protein kinase